MNTATNPARNFDIEHDAAATLARDAYRAHGPRSAEYADALATVASIDRAQAWAGWATLSGNRKPAPSGLLY
jgi:hypothetical protein